MIGTREVPNIEVAPKCWALYYKYDTIINEDGSPANMVLLNVFMTVAYTYEEAVDDVHQHIKEECKNRKFRFYGGNIKIIKYGRWDINHIFDEAYEKYGTPEPVEEEKPEPELLCEGTNPDAEGSDDI